MDSFHIRKARPGFSYSAQILRLFAVAIVSFLALAGCSRESHFNGGSGGELAFYAPASDTSISAMYEADQKSPAPSSTMASDDRNQFLAYIHRLSVEVDRKAINEAYESILKRCAADIKNACSVLRSDLNGSHQANIALRVKPEGVAAITKIAGDAGETVSEGTEAEDLRDAVTDTQKRIAMLESYRERLLVLEQKPNIAIDELIKVASEISNTQSQLEAAAGQKTQLLRRVTLDIVEINLFSQNKRSAWSPLKNSLSEFRGNLTYAVSEVITAIAVFLPWALFLIMVILLLRFLWRFFRRSKS